MLHKDPRTDLDECEIQLVEISLFLAHLYFVRSYFNCDTDDKVPDTLRVFSDRLARRTRGYLAVDHLGESSIA